VLPKLQVIARRLHEFSDLIESANEDSIPISPDTIGRELHNEAAKLRAALLRWQGADVAIRGDGDGN
jgi:hypothetical protein